MAKSETAKKTTQLNNSTAALSLELNQHLEAIRKRLRKPLEAEFARGNLTAPQRIVMRALVESGDMSLKELSAKVSLAHSTVSGIVDRLEARGMVSRRSDETDRRVTKVSASAEVQSFLKDRVPELILHPLESAIGRATAAERAAVLRGVRKLRKLVES